MTKQAWQAHIMELFGTMKRTPEVVAHTQSDCRQCKARRATKRANANRRERDAAMRDLGMVKTKFGWE